MVKMHAVPLKKQKEKVERVLKRFELRRETKGQEFTIVKIYTGWIFPRSLY